MIQTSGLYGVGGARGRLWIGRVVRVDAHGERGRAVFKIQCLIFLFELFAGKCMFLRIFTAYDSVLRQSRYEVEERPAVAAVDAAGGSGARALELLL